MSQTKVLQRRDIPRQASCTRWLGNQKSHKLQHTYPIIYNMMNYNQDYNTQPIYKVHCNYSANINSDSNFTQNLYRSYLQQSKVCMWGLHNCLKQISSFNTFLCIKLKLEFLALMICIASSQLFRITYSATPAFLFSTGRYKTLDVSKFY